MYNGHLIQEMPLGTAFFRSQVERFLVANGLRMEALDAYYTVQDPEGEILAGAGLDGDVIKCVAVREDCRSEGLVAPLISHIIGLSGGRNLKVFTKPENQAVFASLGFHTLASAPQAILMENGRGLEQYCAYLRSLARPGRSGVVVMNANPFTLGHKYLIDKALEQVDTLYVIPVREDRSDFPYAERVEMIRATVMPGPDRASRVVVADGSPYCISAATFPTYFLKDLSQAAETQMRLDLDLFSRHLAPALGATVRFVGSEPSDPLTARYNALMQERIHTVVIDRLSYRGQRPSVSHERFSRYARNDSIISASAVRAALAAGDYAAARALTPESTWPYLLAALVERALRLELDTPLKPGLVGPDGPGAHKDMDYSTMLAGICALRPYWSRMALAPSAPALRELGIEAEQAMLAATGGVNTHRGAIFALGLALNAAFSTGATPDRRMEVINNQTLMQKRMGQIAQTILHKSLEISKIHSTAAHEEQQLIGARRIALTGYKELFEDWLPFYRAAREEAAHAPCGPDSSWPRQKTLLRIMSTLDDTCVLKRVGAERAQGVKREAQEILRFAQNDRTGDQNVICHPEEPQATKDLRSVSRKTLKELCVRYAQEGISPGGAADMLALTIFIDSII